MLTDKFQEECALVGVWNHEEAANISYLGLYAQQHRGQEGAGVVTVDRTKSGEALISVHKGLGLVSDIFGNFDFGKLPGKFAIGHVRYTTAGANKLSNVQPFHSEISSGNVALAHNGNLINAEGLREDLITQGSIFLSNSDTEVILHLLAKGRKTQNPIETVTGALSQIKGAFSLLILFEDRLFAVRDPHGFRPLAIASLDGGIIVASETCAFDLVGATYIRDVAPGEIVEISGDNEIKSYFPFPVAKESPCIFEYVYFARPDSNVFGKNVYKIRQRMGEELAKESPVSADIVVPVPDSGMTAALGYSKASGIPLEMGLIRNHYVGRTFIEPKQSIRDFGVKIKLNANPEILNGKRIVVVDDSIVRGTTSKKLVSMLRKAGATEVHMRISAPPTTDPCYYGIDTPSKEELIASSLSIDKIKEFIGVDSLSYLSVEGLYSAVQSAKGKFCDACFTGEYPVGTPMNYSRKRQVKMFGKA